MKMKDIFIGQIVVMDKDSWRNSYLPRVGKVVDIAYEYDLSTIMVGHVDKELRVLPVVHFVGDSSPTTVAPCNIEPYNPKY